MYTRALLSTAMYSIVFPCIDKGDGDPAHALHEQAIKLVLVHGSKALQW